MTAPDLSSYLKGQVRAFLETFGHWRFERRRAGDESEGDVLYTSKPNGIEVRCDSGDRVRAIFVFNRGVQGFEAYPHHAAEVALGWSRERVRRILGVPKFARGAMTFSEFASGPMDRFDRAEDALCIEYSMAESRVAFMVFDSDPPALSRAS